MLAAIAVAVASVVVAQCGGTGAGTSPSSDSPRTPAPAPGAAPAPAPAGASLSFSPSTIQGQGQPQATVTIGAAAPSGGALVTLTSSEPAVVKLPGSVTVPAGSRSVTFIVDTATVVTPMAVTITATYASGSMSSTLTVTPPALIPSFVVRSRTRGVGACVLEENHQELDCVLDGADSRGFIESWIWTYTAGTSQLTHTSKDAGSTAQISTNCAFLNTATGGDGPNGDKYLNMEVTLQVRDHAGATSNIVRQPVRLYPNRQCGFNY
jgi:hypothetical protein